MPARGSRIWSARSRAEQDVQTVRSGWTATSRPSTPVLRRQADDRHPASNAEPRPATGRTEDVELEIMEASSR